MQNNEILYIFGKNLIEILENERKRNECENKMEIFNTNHNNDHKLTQKTRKFIFLKTIYLKLPRFIKLL